MLKVTYGQIDRLLREYGFRCRMLPKEVPSRVYEHASGALLVFPAFDDPEIVIPRHLVAVRTTLDLWGIATADDFSERLRQAG